MKAEEFRLGNIIKITTLDMVCVVIGIKPDAIRVNAEILRGHYTADKEAVFSGVPLSEEWLVKFGFIFERRGEDVADQIWRKKGFEFWQHSEGFCHDFLTGGDINYVHTLQNIYYYLIGEELTYALTGTDLNQNNGK